VVSLLKDLFQLCFLMRVNKTLRESVITETISAALMRYAARSPVFTAGTKASDRVLRSPIVVAVERTSRERVIFRIEQQDKQRTLSISLCDPCEIKPDAVIRLDELVAASGVLSMDKLMRLLYRNELIRNNPGKMTGQLFSVVRDPVFWRVLSRFAGLYAGSFRKAGGAGG